MERIKLASKLEISIREELSRRARERIDFSIYVGRNAQEKLTIAYH